MNFNSILKALFGDKSSRDMKKIQPFVEKVKAESPKIEALDNDALRARTQEIRQQVQAAAKAQKEEIEKLKATIEDTPLDERADIFAKIDKIEKEALDEYEKAGMKCVGINPAADLVEIVEIPDKHWYIGTQFHPEYSSTVLHPHPLFMSFIKACI